MANNRNELTLKQKLFIEAYLGDAKGNATESARIAGYSGDDNALAQRGFELVRNSKIVPHIQQRIDEAVMSTNEVLKELASIARLAIDPERFQPQDKIRVLDLLAKHHGMYTENRQNPETIARQQEAIKQTVLAMIDEGVDRDEIVNLVAEAAVEEFVN